MRGKLRPALRRFTKPLRDPAVLTRTEVDRLVTRALARDSARRYADYGEEPRFGRKGGDGSGG